MIRARVAMTESPLIELYDEDTDNILGQLDREGAENLREEIHYAVAVAGLTCDVGECRHTQVAHGACLHHGGAS